MTWIYKYTNNRLSLKNVLILVHLFYFLSECLKVKFSLFIVELVERLRYNWSGVRGSQYCRLRNKEATIFWITLVVLLLLSICKLVYSYVIQKTLSLANLKL